MNLDHLTTIDPVKLRSAMSRGNRILAWINNCLLATSLAYFGPALTRAAESPPPNFVFIFADRHPRVTQQLLDLADSMRSDLSDFD